MQNDLREEMEALKKGSLEATRSLEKQKTKSTCICL
jgi:hypothetical protein